MNKDNDDNNVEFIEDEDFSGEATTSNKLKHLRERLSACESEKKGNLEGWQRSKADLINYKKEVAESRSKLIGLGHEAIITDLLSVIDAFYSAQKNRTSWESVDTNWRTGVEYIYNQLLKVFEDYGATLILPNVGDDYCEDLHEASEEMGADNLKITNVLRPGLKINDKVIRPAHVEISA